MTSSPACWAAFGHLLAADYADPAHFAFHQIVVDAWACQHPGEPSRVTAQSVGLHLMTLALVFDFDADPTAGPKLHRRMIGRPAFRWLDPPTDPAWLTVLHMLDATDPAAAARAWGRSTWQAWSTHHATIHGWLRDVDLLPSASSCTDGIP